MDTELALVIGLVFGAVSIPAILAAWADGRLPKAAALVFAFSVVVTYWAVHNHPGPLPVSEIPHVFVRVLARLLHS